MVNLPSFSFNQLVGMGAVAPISARQHSPMRHIGGKAKVSKGLSLLRPRDGSYSTGIDPFGGGASLPLTLCRLGSNPCSRFLVRDTFRPLINFWVVLQDKPADLIGEIASLLNFSADARAIYGHAVSLIHAWENQQATAAEGAAGYYIHAHLCHSYGLFRVVPASYTDSRKPRLVEISRNLGQLYQWSDFVRDWDFQVQDYRATMQEAIRLGEQGFAFIDPPYEKMGKNYGCEFPDEFHDELAHLVDVAAEHGCKCMVTINDSPANRHRYKAHTILVRNQVYASTVVGKQTLKVGTELVILTYKPPFMDIMAANNNWKLADAG